MDPLEGLAYYNRRAPAAQNRRTPIAAYTRGASQPFAGWNYGAYNAPISGDYGQGATQTYAGYVKPADPSHYTDPVRPWHQAPDPYAPDLHVKPPADPQPYAQPVTPRPQAPSGGGAASYVPQSQLMTRRARY